jgi:hypothetical protein
LAPLTFSRLEGFTPPYPPLQNEYKPVSKKCL